MAMSEQGRRTPTLVVVTRFPVPGRVKSRLIPALGEEGAAALHRQMGRSTIEAAREARARMGCLIEVHHEGGDRASREAWLGTDLAFEPQAQGDLGRRLEGAIGSALARGRGPVVIIGSDCPDLGARHIEEAFAGLASHDLVIGPARDGGYYLLGLTRPAPPLFEGIAWGTEQVLERTLAIARDGAMTVHLLEELADVDRPRDLRLLPTRFRRRG